ncbi:MAG: hypothetical protein ACK48K_07300 [Planctomycetota bacterium]
MYNSVRIFFVFSSLIIANRIFVHFPWDRLLVEAGNRNAMFRPNAFFFALVFSALAGYLAPKIVTNQIKKATIAQTFTLLILGYLAFVFSTSLGVRRFIVGTEVWGWATNLEHIIRFAVLICPLFFCLGQGILYFYTRKNRLWVPMLKLIFSTTLAFLFWHFLVLQCASTVLLLDLLEEKNRTSWLFLLFLQTASLGCLLGSLGSLLRTESSKKRLLYVSTNIFFGSILISFLFSTLSLIVKSEYHSLVTGASGVVDEYGIFPSKLNSATSFIAYFCRSCAMYFTLHLTVECLNTGALCECKN